MVIIRLLTEIARAIFWIAAIIEYNKGNHQIAIYAMTWSLFCGQNILMTFQRQKK